jgi:hypothetical protein
MAGHIATHSENQKLIKFWSENLQGIHLENVRVHGKIILNRPEWEALKEDTNDSEEPPSWMTDVDRCKTKSVIL